MYFDAEFQRSLRGPACQIDVREPRPFSRVIKLRGITIGDQSANVDIRLVETSERLIAACDLVNQRYEKKGYGTGHCIPFSPNHMTFTAEIDGAVVGTITLAADSEKGLAADKTFNHEVDGLRAQPGNKVCELTKFAFDSKIHSKQLMAALFHTVYIYGHRRHGSTDLVIEVHPRHVHFYKAMLGFELVSEPKINTSVGAALRLMSLKVADIRQSIICHPALETKRNSRSLYPYFLSHEEEKRLYEELRRPHYDDDGFYSQGGQEMAVTRPLVHPRSVILQ